MTNPELIPEKAAGNLPSVSPPTTAPTEVENISLNPLFQPDLLEHLAQTIIQELQRHDLKAEVAKGLSPDRDDLVPSTPATSPAAVGERPTVPLAVPLATPSFYFITVRPSLAFYNTKAEVDALVAALERFQRQ